MLKALVVVIALFIPAAIFAEESAVISEGTGYDRESGIEYVWSIRDNGAIEIIGQEIPSANYFKIGIFVDGKMITMKKGESWEYMADADICKSTKGVYLRGLKCIPSVVDDFFSNHEFDPPHPIFARLRN